MPAAPASGKFGGFGSEDLTKFGYNQPGQFGQAYDPYVKTNTNTATDKPKKESVSEDAEKKKKKKKKKSKKDDSDSSDDSSDDSDSSSSDSEEKKPKKTKGLKDAPKATRTIEG